MNEGLGSSLVNQEVMQQYMARAYLILDEGVRDIIRQTPFCNAAVVGGDRIDHMIEKGMTVVQADSLEELGAKIVAETADGVSFNANNMVATVNAYNEAAAAGTADKLDVPHLGVVPATPLVTPPFYAIPVVGGIMATFGGLKINTEAQVIGTERPPHRRPVRRAGLRGRHHERRLLVRYERLLRHRPHRRRAGRCHQGRVTSRARRAPGASGPGASGSCAVRRAHCPGAGFCPPPTPRPLPGAGFCPAPSLRRAPSPGAALTCLHGPVVLSQIGRFLPSRLLSGEQPRAGRAWHSRSNDLRQCAGRKRIEAMHVAPHPSFKSRMIRRFCGRSPLSAGPKAPPWRRFRGCATAMGPKAIWLVQLRVSDRLVQPAHLFALFIAARLGYTAAQKFFAPGGATRETAAATRRRRHVELLEERIRRDGVVKSEGVLKVDSFLNHQLDIDLFEAMGVEFKRLFAGALPSRRSSPSRPRASASPPWWRIISACPWCSRRRPSPSTWTARCIRRASSPSPTTASTTSSSPRRFLGPDDHVLIIDDFLANGCALRGLLETVTSAGATVEGIGIAVEKGLPARRRRAARGGLRPAVARHRRGHGSRLAALSSSA